MNLVILLLLLANVAGVYYSKTQLPPRPSQYPQASATPPPTGVAILSLQKTLPLAKTEAHKNNELELSFDTAGWGDTEARAQAAKITEANAWDEIEDKQSKPAAKKPVIALNQANTKTITPRAIDLSHNPDMPPPVVINISDLPQTAHKTSPQAPDSPVFELNPPIFAHIKTTETAQIVLNKPGKIKGIKETELNIPVEEPQIIISADIAHSLLKGLETKISPANTFKPAQQKPILTSVIDAFAAKDSINPQLSTLLPSKHSLNISQAVPQFLGEAKPSVKTEPPPKKELIKPPAPLVIKTPYTAEPDASDLVFALAGSSPLAHLQTPLPEPSPTKPILTEAKALIATKESPKSIEKPEAVKLVWQCYRSATFKQKSTAKQALSWWQAKTSKVKLIQTQQIKKGNIQLYLPAFTNKTEATLAMKHLKQVGIGHYLLQKPKYAIAVGTFSSEHNARKQRNKLKKYGYHQVKQKTQHKIKNRYYLSLEINQQQQNWLNDFAKTQQHPMPQKTSHCPTE